VLLGNNSYLTELDPTQPILNKKLSTQPNPTQLMGQPNPWPCLVCRHLELSVEANDAALRQRRLVSVFRVLFQRLMNTALSRRQ